MTPSSKRDPRLLVGAAALALVAAGAGFGLARLAPAPAAPAQEAEAPHEAEALVMTPAAATAAGIVTEPVLAGGLAAEVQAQGAVTSTPNGQAAATARAAGAVTRIFKRLGDPVRAGETLAIVESRDAAQIAADRSVAAARAVLAQRTLAREKSLYDQKVSPRADYEQAQAEAAVAGAEARRAGLAAGAARVTADGRGVAVVSPIAGRILSAPANLGAYVQPETELFRIADPSRLQIEAVVAGAEAGRIAVGDRAVVTLADGRSLEAVVRSVTPGLDAHTLSATAVLDAPAGALQAGQSVRVRLHPRSAAAGAAMAAPEEAVQTVEGRTVVFVRTPAGFEPRPVVVGRRSAGRVEIVSGLTAGQVIATRGAFLLKAELAKAEGEGHH